VRSRGIGDHQQRLLERLRQAVVGRSDHGARTASGAAVGSAATMERLRRDIGWWLSYIPRLIGHFRNRRQLGQSVGPALRSARERMRQSRSGLQRSPRSRRRRE
jgi:hypothetical protein